MTSIWELPNVYFQNQQYSSSTIHHWLSQKTTFNLKGIFHQQHPRQQPSTSKAYLSTSMHTLWAKIGWVSIFLKNWFQIDANDLNLRVTKCIFSKSTPHQQYTRKQPSTSKAYLSTPMHSLWAKIRWVSRFQIDANDLNLRVANQQHTRQQPCIFSKSSQHIF